MKCALILVCVGLATTFCFSQVPEGLPRQLAREQAANISDVHYKLSLTLTPHATDVPGTVEITFALERPTETLLNYRDGELKSVRINGNAVEARTANGHIFIPAGSLHAGQNTMRAEFISHMGPAGKPIVQYEDKDDGSEYMARSFTRKRRAC